jgi:hypothetical protein
VNERIRELADKAAEYSAKMFLPSFLAGGNTGNELFLERFAQLIIEECCNQLHDPNRYSDGDFAKWRIHQHFGLVYEPIHQ